MALAAKFIGQGRVDHQGVPAAREKHPPGLAAAGGKAHLLEPRLPQEAFPLSPALLP